MKKVLVAMSGGVDSSVCAKLLVEKGYECMGCTMKLYEGAEDETTSEKTCCSLSDVEDARSVATKLNMPYHVFNFKDDFYKYVISDFINCYECGKTPNPCIMCNKFMKFDKLLDRAYELGYDAVATGHYARIEFENGKYKLKKAIDLTKDQSYVLYNLSQDQLAHILFPLGGMTKNDARDYAEENGFVNARKHDSQDICFVPDGDYASVIRRYTKKDYPTGDFVDMEGNVLGQHKGIISYTIGQRRGLGISAPAPLYVVKLDVENNRVVLGSNDDLFKCDVLTEDFHWIDGDDIPTEFKCKAKIRYSQTEQPCSVKYLGDGRAKILFDQPQRAITPGQIAVLYDEDIVLGGGVIIE